jgi:GNAT superfamily N-acetyltransferase
MSIHHVTLKDKEFWYSLDRHLPEAEFDKKVRDRQGYVLTENGLPIALLRYNLFWDNTPFCTMLYVAQPHQGRGYGKALMRHWEEEMQNLGFGMVMTSTQVDESAQYFYRKLGYQDAGGFVLNIPGYEQPMEMIMVKEI